MADRNLDTKRSYGKGLVDLDFSFLTNAGSNPLASSYRGASTDVVKSIAYAATGKYTVTLQDKYRYIVSKFADLEDASSPDGAGATIGPPSNEGSSTVGPSFVVTTCAADGTPTAYTGRRVSLSLTLKNSTVGV